MKYGLIGLGNLGTNIAKNLISSGFKLAAHDKNRNSFKSIESLNALWCDTPSELAAQVDCVITCLPSPKISNEVMLGVNGALASMKSGTTWIETSTTNVNELKLISNEAAKRGISTLEAPVTGGIHRAAAGKITILVGGKKSVLEKHRAALESFGEPIFHLGDVGTASILKVITNMLAFVNLVGAGEGLLLAKKAGIDLSEAYKAIQASSGNSAEFETVAPVILNGSFNTAFTLELACKDLGLMMDLGKDYGVPLKFAGLMDQMFIEAKEKYGASEWTPHVVKLMEENTHTELRAPGFPDRMMDADSVKNHLSKTKSDH